MLKCMLIFLLVPNVLFAFDPPRNLEWGMKKHQVDSVIGHKLVVRVIENDYNRFVASHHRIPNEDRTYNWLLFDQKSKFEDFYFHNTLGLIGFDGAFFYIDDEFYEEALEVLTTKYGQPDSVWNSEDDKSKEYYHLWIDKDKSQLMYCSPLVKRHLRESSG